MVSRFIILAITKGIQMTTEAEEYTASKEKFDGLYKNYIENFSEKSFITIILSHSILGRIPKHNKDASYLKIINDRLEMALQGKKKND